MSLLSEVTHKREISPGAFVEVERGWWREPELENGDSLLKSLMMGLEWEHREFRAGVMMPRKECIYGFPGMSYTYSGIRYDTTEWTPLLEALALTVSDRVGQKFSAVFCNLYRNERDSIGWHSDFERNLGPAWPNDIVVASLSLGATRRFRLRNRSGAALEWELAHGDLIVMSGTLMRDWEHCVPKETKPCKPRVNLTFRVLQ